MKPCPTPNRPTPYSAREKASLAAFLAMPEQPRTRLATGAVKIGRRYSVPLVLATCYSWTPLPIFGPLHEDREIIGFPDHHWHFDWRFMSKDYWDHFSIRQPLARVLSLQNAYGNGIIRYAIRTAKRAMPEFPDTGPWMRKMEDAYAGQTLKPGLICPHRGLSLVGCPVKDGAIVCPGHGLKWEVASGQLIRRKPLP